MGGSIGHGLSGQTGREKTTLSGNILIVDLNNCLKSSAYILRIQVLVFVAIYPCKISLRLQGESHASCLPSTEPTSYMPTFTCLSGEIRVRQVGMEWGRVN